MSRVYDKLAHPAMSERTRQETAVRPHAETSTESPTEGRRARMTEDFGRDLDGWLKTVEERLAPAGRQTSPVTADASPPPAVDVAPMASAPPPTRSDEGRETDAMLRDRARMEALVTVVKELAAEVRSSRRDIEQIKTVIAKLQVVTDARTRAAQSAGQRATTQK